MSIDNGEIIRRLRSLGEDSATEGFRKLCSAAGVCSICLEPWDPTGDCPCTRAPKEPTP